eukprot:CAMPEP_0119266238 /NCGR_PEP_ID=MMETSP1329-20130426/4791_1 /TAXON_ID=114041 /ORGANISM="Genus nov. species nov., Strain RCC1024" /LENGTH=292 /DNA_ID=CAMNT_0007266107 /DNA_START=178 /DNA_END=1056 /DNA_ORIENTATION=-
MSASLRQLKCITFDVTGTLVSFRGSLGHHYVSSAARCGINVAESPGVYKYIEKGFGAAYKETHAKYPCFGADQLSVKEWWRECILRSFEIAREAGGLADVPPLDDDQRERVFQRIYALFGSHSTYGVFEDAIPFLRWARDRKIVTGIVSNADERYGDAILPMLDLSDHVDFCVFARDVGAMKPDLQIFDAAVGQANVARRALYPFGPEIVAGDMLHVGNDFANDYEGARAAGMHAVLLDRFGDKTAGRGDSCLSLSAEGVRWKEAGAPVCGGLLGVLERIARSDAALGAVLP